MLRRMLRQRLTNVSVWETGVIDTEGEGSLDEMRSGHGNGSEIMNHQRLQRLHIKIQVGLHASERGRGGEAANDLTHDFAIVALSLEPLPDDAVARLVGHNR